MVILESYHQKLNQYILLVYYLKNNFKIILNYLLIMDMVFIDGNPALCWVTFLLLKIRSLI